MLQLKVPRLKPEELDSAATELLRKYSKPLAQNNSPNSMEWLGIQGEM